MPQLGVEPPTFCLCALTTEPLGPVVVEVTRMPNIPIRWVHYQHSTSFCLNTFPQLFSFLCFILSSSPPPSLFLSFCFVDFTFVLSFLPIFFLPLSFFFPFSLPPFHLVCPTNHWPLLNMEGHIVLALRKLI